MIRLLVKLALAAFIADAYASGTGPAKPGNPANP
jgi:hypothetical protein